MDADSSGSLAGCLVLVVEDHPQSLELLRIYLGSLEGIAILSAGDGQAAIELAEVHRPDLVVLDVMMPRMSGFEVCRRLKDHPATRDTAVLIVTALDSPADAERVAECKADGYLTKPFERAVFLDHVRRLLIRRKSKLSRSPGPATAKKPKDEGPCP
ncbi:MAG: response regulator [bacterium]|nr:response regulator [bacterium]